FDRADLILHAQEPTISPRKNAKSFLPRNLLVSVHSSAERIQTCRREIDLEPRIERRDMDAVAVNADLNAMIDDCSERRTYYLRIARRDPAECGHLHSAAESLKTCQEFGVHDRNVMDHPSQVGNVEFLVDRFIRFDHLRQIGQAAYA